MAKTHQEVQSRRLLVGVRGLSGLVSVLLVLSIVTVPGAVLGDELDRVYSQGKRAFERQRWTESAQLMARAIEDEPNAKPGTLLGSPYIPHFYLGSSLFELGSCDAAMTHLERSLNQGAVLKTKQAPRLDEMMGTCAARERQLDLARQEVVAAHRLAERLEALTLDPALGDYWNQGFPPPLVQFREAKLVLDRAEGLLAGGPPREIPGNPTLQVRPLTDVEISNARQITAQVETLLESLDDATVGQVENAEPSRQALLDEVLKLRMQAVWAWGSTSRWAKATHQGRDLESRFDRVTRLHLGDSQATASQLREVRLQLTEFLAAVSTLPAPRPRRAPTLLRQAADAYFSGRYEEALALLENVTFESRQAQAQQLLFRAAAFYSLYLIAMPPDPDLLRLAAESVDRCLDVDASLEPMAEAFSPRFIRFFNEQASADGEESLVARVPASR